MQTEYVAKRNGGSIFEQAKKSSVPRNTVPTGAAGAGKYATEKRSMVKFDSMDVDAAQSSRSSERLEDGGEPTRTT